MKKVVLVVLVSILLVALFLKFRETSNKQPRIHTQNKSPEIARKTYEKKIKESLTFFEWKKQNITNLTSLHEDTIDNLANEYFINQYALQQKISVAEREINSKYAQVVRGYNRRNKILGEGDLGFLSEIKKMYGTEKSDYLLTLKEEITREKVQASLNMPLADWLKIQKKSVEIKIL